jgi:hypothetical protein
VKAATVSVGKTFQGYHQGSVCDLFLFGSCDGKSCGTQRVTSRTDYGGFCLGPVVGGYNSQLSFDPDGQTRKQEIREIAEKFEAPKGKAESECELAGTAFTAWLDYALRSTR